VPSQASRSELSYLLEGVVGVVLLSRDNCWKPSKKLECSSIPSEKNRPKGSGVPWGKRVRGEKVLEGAEIAGRLWE